MPDLSGAERVVTDAWIIQAIASVSAGLETINTGLSSRVFEGVAPFSTPYPFIIYQCQDDPTDIRGVGTVTIMTSTQYLVKVLAPTSYSGIGPIVALLHTVLTTSVGAALAGGGHVLDSVKSKGFHLTEIVDGKTLRHLGSLYDIHVQGN
jgi:hypothetical protein